MCEIALAVASVEQMMFDCLFEAFFGVIDRHGYSDRPLLGGYWSAPDGLARRSPSNNRQIRAFGLMMRKPFPLQDFRRSDRLQVIIGDRSCQMTVKQGLAMPKRGGSWRISFPASGLRA